MFIFNLLPNDKTDKAEQHGKANLYFSGHICNNRKFCKIKFKAHGRFSFIYITWFFIYHFWLVFNYCTPFCIWKIDKKYLFHQKKRFPLNLAVKDLKTEIKKLPSLTRTVMFTWFFSISNKDLSFHHIKVFPIEFWGKNIITPLTKINWLWSLHHENSFTLNESESCI